MAAKLQAPRGDPCTRFFRPCSRFDPRHHLLLQRPAGRVAGEEWSLAVKVGSDGEVVERADYDAQDRLVSFGDVTYEHDPLGRRTARVEGEDRTEYGDNGDLNYDEVDNRRLLESNVESRDWDFDDLPNCEDVSPLNSSPNAQIRVAEAAVLTVGMAFFPNDGPNPYIIRTAWHYPGVNHGQPHGW